MNNHHSLTLKTIDVPLNKGWSYGVREVEVPIGHFGGTDMAIYSEDGLIETRRTYENYGSALATNAGYPNAMYADMYGNMWVAGSGACYFGNGGSWTTITGISSSSMPSFAPLTKDKIVFCAMVAPPMTITVSTKTAAATTGSSLTDCCLGVCCSHQNRVWIAGGCTSPYPYGKIWYSDPGDPDSGYSGTNYVYCGESGVEQILAMHSMGQYMYVIKQNSIWVMVGTRLEGSDFTVISRERFFKGGSCLGGGNLWVLGSNGLYVISGLDIQRIPMPFEWLFATHARTAPTWVLSYWEKMGWVFLSFPDTSNIYDTYLYIYDTRKGVWYFWDNPGLTGGISTSKGEFITSHYGSKQLRNWGSLNLVGSGGVAGEATLTSNLKTPWLGDTRLKYLESIEFDTTADRCDVHMRTTTDAALGTAAYTTTIDHTGTAVYAPERWFRNVSLKLYRSDSAPFRTRSLRINYWEED